jgi:hypothetical protein
VIAVLGFCAHVECLDRELRFLIAVEAMLWQESGSQRRSYQAAARRFREEVALQAVHREPRA